jgi:hypothetical protein
MGVNIYYIHKLCNNNINNIIFNNKDILDTTKCLILLIYIIL